MQQWNSFFYINFPVNKRAFGDRGPGVLQRESTHVHHDRSTDYAREKGSDAVIAITSVGALMKNISLKWVLIPAMTGGLSGGAMNYEL
jgi:hypothetical protein